MPVCPDGDVRLAQSTIFSGMTTVTTNSIGRDFDIGCELTWISAAPLYVHNLSLLYLGILIILSFPRSAYSLSPRGPFFLLPSTFLFTNLDGVDELACWSRWWWRPGNAEADSVSDKEIL